MLADLAAAEGAAATLAAQVRDILDGLPLRIIKFNPDYVAQELETLRHLMSDAQREQDAAIDRMRRRIREELTPMLARQEKLATAAALPERVADIERRLDDLERGGRIIPMRRAE